MEKKKRRIENSCPQCGCSGLTTKNQDEIKEKYGDVPNSELECHECLIKVQEEKEKKDQK